MGRQRGAALSHPGAALTRRRAARILAPLAVALVVLGATEPTAAPQRVEVLSRSESRSFFPIGWYDSLGGKHRLTDIAEDGMNTVLPYDTPAVDPGVYLDAAKEAGVNVMLEIPRALVRARDAGSIASFVRRYREHPALYGWYLADEPTTTPSLGRLDPNDAERLYAAIKRVDDSRPVAMAFNAGERIGRFLGAMDVPMYDDYPARAEHVPFQRFVAWWGRLSARGRIARTEDGFIPILQAFGGPPEAPFFGRRLPTAGEERYMVYASLQAGATGLFFWTRYRADDAWVKDVLRPIVAELRPMLPALAAGALRTSTTVRGERTGIALYRDPRTKDVFLVVVHHGDGKVPVTVRLDPALGVTRAHAHARGEGENGTDVTENTLRAELGPFDARVFRLS